MSKDSTLTMMLPIWKWPVAMYSLSLVKTITFSPSSGSSLMRWMAPEKIHGWKRFSDSSLPLFKKMLFIGYVC